MYTLVSAVAKKLGGDERWLSLDIGGASMNTLFATYSKIIATLTNPFLTAPVALDLASIRGAVGGESISFNTFLIQNGDAGLATTTVLPILKPTFAQYADAFHAGYKITPVPDTAAIDASLPPSDRTALRLTRHNTDYELFYRSCLINVNGFFHLTDADVHGIYVKDGNRSAQLSRQNQIGIISFRTLGALECLPVTPAMIYKQDSTQPYRKHCFVNLGIDVSNKTIMLVLGGYLHVLDRRTFYRVSNQCICIDFSNLPLLDRFYESQEYLDLTSLHLETTNRNPRQVGIEDLTSDASLVALLGLSQSFVVVLDNPEIFTTKQPLRRTLMPDMFVSDIVPNLPLIVGIGKMANYWYTPEDGQFSVTCHDSLRPNAIYGTVDALAESSVSGARMTTNPVVHSQAHWLEIGCDLV